MRITVINGSPKGEVSVTMQYLEYIRKNNPGHKFTVINVGHDIKKIEKNTDRFGQIIEEIGNSEGVLWCFPVYVFLIPSQLKRFIEMVFENKEEGAFKDKYATALTTSIHFFDHTAHNYIHAVSEDLGMKYVEGYSAHMMDLLKSGERRNLLNFASDYLSHIENRLPVEVGYTPVSYDIPEYTPGDIEDVPNTKAWKIILLTDAGEKDVNLNRMTDVFLKRVPNEVEVINLNDIDIRGGCLGCMKCGYAGVCAYKDDMMSIYRDKLLPADAVIYAGTIKDRYLSSRWKMFFDRSFLNGHRPVLQGKQFGYIISGPLRQISNLREILDAHVEVGETNAAALVTDEYEDSGYITSLIDDLASRLIWALEEGFRRPWTFLRVGGHKIFRDFVFTSRIVCKADHDYYRENGLYDFPQKKVGMRVLNLFVPSLLKIPRVRERFTKELKAQMIRPYRKVLKE